MRLAELLPSLSRVFLDTAPIIYYTEKHPLYFGLVAPLFQAIDAGEITAVTSVITLSECLVYPYLRGLTDLQRDYFDLIVHGANVEFVLQDERTGRLAAELRARYRVELPDALQIATALQANCTAFLTNDTELKRIQELSIVVVKELTP
ncbi:MAG: PIN domain-containing protein [Armatimonadetes bacterium]|nr:PIN domain-containing protein [Armatimonadota bacterium]